MVYPRKEEKSYGTKVQVEGIFSPDDTVVVIDDLITTGDSKLEAIHKLVKNGLIIKDIVVLIDRSVNAGQFLKKQGYQLHAFLTISELIRYYQETERIAPEIAAEVNQYLEKE
jgi:uridine monophosphate synthetase